MELIEKLAQRIRGVPDAHKRVHGRHNRRLRSGLAAKRAALGGISGHPFIAQAIGQGGVIVPMAGLLVFLLPKLRPGFDMLLDVVNHFYFRPAGLRNVMEDDDEFDFIFAVLEILFKLLNVSCHAGPEFHHPPFTKH